MTHNTLAYLAGAFEQAIRIYLRHKDNNILGVDIWIITEDAEIHKLCVDHLGCAAIGACDTFSIPATAHMDMCRAIYPHLRTARVKELIEKVMKYHLTKPGHGRILSEPVREYRTQLLDSGDVNRDGEE